MTFRCWNRTIRVGVGLFIHPSIYRKKNRRSYRYIPAHLIFCETIFLLFIQSKNRVNRRLFVCLFWSFFFPQKSTKVLQLNPAVQYCQTTSRLRTEKPSRRSKCTARRCNISYINELRFWLGANGFIKSSFFSGHTVQSLFLPFHGLFIAPDRNSGLMGTEGTDYLMICKLYTDYGAVSHYFCPRRFDFTWVIFSCVRRCRGFNQWNAVLSFLQVVNDNRI